MPMRMMHWLILIRFVFFFFIGNGNGVLNLATIFVILLNANHWDNGKNITRACTQLICIKVLTFPFQFRLLILNVSLLYTLIVKFT